MEIKNAVKERVFAKLASCLGKLTKFDVQSIMPLFYVLVAHHKGYHLSIVGRKDSHLFVCPNRYIQFAEDCDGLDSTLLTSIRNSVEPSWFEGEYADIVFDFYYECNQYINDYYLEIINYIIDYFSRRTGKYSGIVATSNAMGSLMAKLVARLGAKSVYDPCAGLCTYAIQPEMKEIDFVGSDLGDFTYIIAKIRLDAAGKKALYFQADCTDYYNWNINSCDCLVSEPPFYLRLEIEEEHLSELPAFLDKNSNIEDYLVYRFIKDNRLRTAVLLLPACFMGQRKRSTYELRKMLVEQNLVETIITLPAGILAYTGIKTSILVLNKDKRGDMVQFVQAEDCAIIHDGMRSVDLDAIIGRLYSDCPGQQVCIVGSEEIKEEDYDFSIGLYIDEINILPGQRIVRLTDIARIIRPSRIRDAREGRVLKTDQMFSDVAEMSVADIKFEVEDISSQRNLRLFTQPCVIFNMLADKFYIKKDKLPLYVSQSYTCVIPDETKCLPEYLAYVVATSKKIKRGQIERADLSVSKLAIYESLDIQQNIVNRLYREGQQRLKEKLEKLQVLNDDASDLVHNLGLTFTRMSASLQVLQTNLPDEIMSALSDNIRYAVRQINSTGADYSKIPAQLKKVNLQDIITEYLREWENYGYRTFKVALPNPKELPTDMTIEVDEEQLFTALDCILINAHQHGFNKHLQESNSVVIKLSAAVYNGEDYAVISVSNNGNPLPEQFGLEDFVKRGTVGLNSSQDGLGGDHIHQIMKHFDGKVSLESDSEWVTVNLLIPYYTSDNNFKANDYEYECV